MRSYLYGMSKYYTTLDGQRALWEVNLNRYYGWQRSITSNNNSNNNNNKKQKTKKNTQRNNKMKIYQ